MSDNLKPQQDPAYHQGFHDAAKMESLYDGAAPEYAAGWRAYWECRELLTQMGADIETIEAEIGGPGA